MGKIERVPFYAAEVIPADVGTYGGVVTDVHARVLATDGSPIEGLNACGISTASPCGGVYPGAGASVGPSMTFGWIPARHAAGLDNQPGRAAELPACAKGLSPFAIAAVDMHRLPPLKAAAYPVPRWRNW